MGQRQVTKNDVWMNASLTQQQQQQKLSIYKLQCVFLTIAHHPSKI